MNKSAFAVLALIACQTPAFAKVVAPEASCVSKYVADAGYTVLVYRSPVDGKLELKLDRITFVGEIPVGTLRVEQTEDYAAKTRSFIGLNIALALDLSAADQNGRFSGTLSGSVLPYQEFTDMSCEVLNPEIAKPLPPMPTCMAYFTGVALDLASGKCVQTGGSGCSNPFEFQTIEACELAFALRK